MNTLLVRIQDNLTQLIDPEKELKNLKFLLAVSGGMDSMVMAHSFSSLELDFGVVHFNFQLRGEASDLDEKLVRTFCHKNNIPFYSKSQDAEIVAETKQLSIQETARDLRYKFFDDILKSEQFDFVCTAHHGNDQLETFFINLFRGSGLKGLTGIPSRRNLILRPMLWIPQHKLRRYADEHKVEFREDESNKSNKYLRNRVRHHIIEPITNTDPVYLTKSLDSIQLLTEYQMFMEIQVDLFCHKYVNSYSGEVQMVRGLSEIIQNVSDYFLLKLYLLDQDLYPDSIEDFIGSTGNWRTGKRYEGDSTTAWHDRNSIWLIRDSFKEGWQKDDKIELTTGKRKQIPGDDYVELLPRTPGSIEPGTWIIPINKDEVSLPLYMRHRQPGDFIEAGSPPYYQKSLKKLFNDFRIPRPFKDRLYLVTDSEGNIVSVPGLFNSPRYTANQDTGMILRYRSSLSFLLE